MNSTQPTNECASSQARPAKPKRPLSAFNLFYRFKRQKVLEAVAVGTAVDRLAICNLVTTPPGMEEYRQNTNVNASPYMLNALRRKSIRQQLESNLEPRDTRDRAHRKNQGAMNGAMSFVELGKLMNTSWKHCDEFAKSVFNELAESGRVRYRKRVAQYNAICHPNKKVKVDKGSQPNKKRSMDSATARASPGTSDEGSDDSSAMNETAAVMVQLSKRIAPSSEYKLLGSTATNGRATAPSLLEVFSAFKPKDVPAKIAVPAKIVSPKPKETSAPSKVMAPRLILPPKPNQISAPPNVMASRQIGPPKQLSSAPNDVEQRLMSRVRELESQLAAERLQARVKELEVQMNQRRAREGMLRSVLENVVGVSQNRAPMAARPPTNQSFMQEELWRLGAERAAMLSRIAGSRHPVLPPTRHASTAPPSESPPVSHKEGNLAPTIHTAVFTNKKQRLS